MNYTVATHPDPLLNATAVHCALSEVLQENYKRDYKMQAEQDELVELLSSIVRQQGLLDFWEDTVASLAAFMPPSPPPCAALDSNKSSQ